MFILIPLILILASVVGVFVIIFRKMPYLNKLTPETHISTQVSIGREILDDLLPELLGVFKNLKLREYGNLWFIELEKFLRKLRVVFLKIDRISDAWIKKIRNGNISRTTTSNVSDKTEEIEVSAPKIQSAPVITMEDMKKEEQGLIIEIAKSPKDSRLYETLGDLYIKMNNLSDAKESFEAAIELNPHSEELQKKHSRLVKKMVV